MEWLALHSGYYAWQLLPEDKEEQLRVEPLVEKKRPCWPLRRQRGCPAMAPARAGHPRGQPRQLGSPAWPRGPPWLARTMGSLPPSTFPRQAQVKAYAAAKADRAPRGLSLGLTPDGKRLHGSRLKMPSTLFEDSAPFASLDCLKARAAPMHPRAPPEQLGSLPGASAARLRPLQR